MKAAIWILGIFLLTLTGMFGINTKEPFQNYDYWFSLSIYEFIFSVLITILWNSRFLKSAFIICCFFIYFWWLFLDGYILWFSWIFISMGWDVGKIIFNSGALPDLIQKIKKKIIK